MKNYKPVFKDADLKHKGEVIDEYDFSGGYPDKGMLQKVVDHLNWKLRQIYDKNHEFPFNGNITLNELRNDTNAIVVYDDHVEFYFDSDRYRFEGTMVLKDDEADFIDE